MEIKTEKWRTEIDGYMLPNICASSDDNARLRNSDLEELDTGRLLIERADISRILPTLAREGILLNAPDRIGFMHAADWAVNRLTRIESMIVSKVYAGSQRDNRRGGSFGTR